MTLRLQTFPNFSSALAACAGYNDVGIADVIAYKTAISVDPRQFAPEQAINSILSVGIAAAELTDRPLNVLDFGGGCGFHYFRVVAAMRMQLQWAIVETPIMAERAVKLAQTRFDVFTEISAAAAALKRIDLVHTSGAIQYVPEPLVTLQALAQLRPRYFMLARFPVWGRDQVVILQRARLSDNGIGPMPPMTADRMIDYPVTLTNFDDVMQTLAEYEIVLAIPSASAEYVVGDQRVQGISLVCRLRENRIRT